MLLYRMKTIEPPVQVASDLRIAGMLDELSELFFPHECKFLNLDFTNWKEQIEEFKPHIFFVESIWNGFNKSWKRKLLPKPSDEFLDLLKWCNSNAVPTVFWNKEDPIHFTTFLHIASYFDYVLTTDLDCVPLYKRLLGHDQIYCMPFASCVQIYSPLEKYKRVNAACFAGSFYNKREERKKDFEDMIENLTKYGEVVIYDRNPYPGNTDYMYPKKYKKLIAGSLPPSKVDIAYKSYTMGITLNIVKHSSTMQARRAFELLSCNTLVVSNECQGLKTIFGDLIIQFEDPDTFQRRLTAVLSDQLLLDKIRLAALRKVLSQHTYKERIEFIYEIVYKTSANSNSPRITIYSIVEDIAEATSVITLFKRQKYQYKRLYIFTDKWSSISNQIDDSNISVVPKSSMSSAIFNDSDYCAFLRPNNYYGENYLTDLVLSLKYEKVTAVGKGCYYSYRDNSFELKDGNKKYVITDNLKIDRSIISVNYIKEIGFESNFIDSSTINGVPCLSIDPFNFCEGYPFEKCDLVDDIELNEGVSMQVINEISDFIKPESLYYDIPLSIKGNHLFNIVHTPKSLQKYITSDGSVGLYTVDSIKKTIKLDFRKKITVEEYCNSEGLICVYLNTVVQGHFRLLCSFYDAQDRYLGANQLLPTGCTTIRKKESSHYLTFTMEIKSDVQVIIKEIALNPTPKSSLVNLLKKQV
ncbi:glycosyltransferase [Paenibacillus thiaminolyticus]|uniref:Glycosyltransferase n=1 Tax=Paenibacillus thiaminolyticus TaxID=49283 RepID=A0ABT4FRX3_PANTH|nr:glycosyltransferase [Paenibacillus thiaminolyticus]MCY9537773.1 glycosyltransferase [Paenibacillus thiaminolyticus]MCY9604038.1 glycosyltransferase [Paenibacillus thiaminolyticus]MCY9606917.1 glycosyltransferase [Paenibacillus thiaminolyticus]MCY9616264.1 glycosyltransferase [Paenibacillus thiaminolyticus]MCY9619363.1 glycosyltransferase [Paenibacillus thiaminolyticus]